MNRFSFDAQPKALKTIRVGRDIRITVLTPCLLRVEKGSFTDLATQCVWNRRFEETDFAHHMTAGKLVITTAETVYNLDVKSGEMVSVLVSDGSMVTDFQKGNLLGTARTLDRADGAIRLEKGILSRSGVAVMDDSDSLLLEQDGRILPRESCSDVYYFAYGHDYKRCLKDFYRLTGNVPLIPKFALGNWWSRYRAYTQQEYRDLMQRFLDRKIPITVATIDMDWHWTDVADRFGKEAMPSPGKNKQEQFYNRFVPGWTGYSWNTELFPNYRQLLDWLHEQNFKVTLNVHPSQGIRFFEDCYEAFCMRMGIDPSEKKQIEFDVSDIRFMEAYFDLAHHGLEDDGVDFWWLDWQQGKESRIPGLDPLWALNHYHSLDSGRGDKRPLILSRYAGLGSHRYPLGFSGDTYMTWNSLDFQPYFTNNAANAGYTWWSHDIGGHYFGVQDDELYLRWLQYGVFSPINRLHSTCSDYMGKEPWKRSYAVRTVSEHFLRLRHRLIPYLYSANYRTHTEGIPICMPMYYQYDCEDAYKAKNQYFFGGQLLVCPITQPGDPRLNLAWTKAWLPEGRWTDIFNGRIYEGGRWVKLYRDLDSIPVLAPAGAIVPMYANGESNDLSLDQPLEIHIWHGNGSFRLYEDDGETNRYRQGAWAVTGFEISEDEAGIHFVIHPPVGDSGILPRERQFILRFRDLLDDQGREVVMNVNFTGAKLQLHLNGLINAVNTPKDQLKTELLTRVQGSNQWKNTVFPKRMPGFVQDALDEFDAMV